MRGKLPMAIRITRVSTAVASFLQSVASPSFAGSSCPVSTAKEEAMPRWVTGIPAYAGTAMAELTPGTTSKGMPALASASASSPPRPKTNGSPPLSLTTTRPALA